MYLCRKARDTNRKNYTPKAGLTHSEGARGEEQGSRRKGKLRVLTWGQSRAQKKGHKGEHEAGSTEKNSPRSYFPPETTRM